ncbi:cytochrome c oxidase subunit 5B, mitochondrial-like [Hyposmocoma kahamanoa]|uniref:cytochrome c oxidase subunit 5B, mitochondrial-like n=1 Tax=Hyposmocoma kahamanoa TaxID=1477025 RepID=UPI000E6D7019|nr:cytochrome c oxidase subunit 5B, mitochondrial-like [Hyposmocoma kahamanoa]XP_026332215.1 cytochrome c oxidase subunit 5B, mitochondrial-like [Hyposmocoma kahamanoa]
MALLTRSVIRRMALLEPALARLTSTSPMHDPLEHVTGIEKRELLAHLAGDCDPFRICSIKKGPGTRERPNLIPSAFSKRLVACSCNPVQNHVEYMWLHQGCPKRCGCGFWFELCPIAPL